MTLRTETLLALLAHLTVLEQSCLCTSQIFMSLKFLVGQSRQQLAVT